MSPHGYAQASWGLRGTLTYTVYLSHTQVWWSTWCHRGQTELISCHCLRTSSLFSFPPFAQNTIMPLYSESREAFCCLMYFCSQVLCRGWHLSNFQQGSKIYRSFGLNCLSTVSRSSMCVLWTRTKIHLSIKLFITLSNLTLETNHSYSIASILCFVDCIISMFSERKWQKVFFQRQSIFKVGISSEIQFSFEWNYNGCLSSVQAVCHGEFEEPLFLLARSSQ